MDKFDEAISRAHGFRFDRFRFDEPDYEMLLVNDETDYLEHLRVQGAGLAYYGALSRQAERGYDEFERRVKYRYNEMYSECSRILAREGRRNNVRDIESFVRTKYEKELDTMYGKLSELRAQRDNIAAFLEGWRQKSFILTSMTSMITAGLLSPRTAITEEDVKNNLERSREILSRIHRNRTNRTEAASAEKQNGGKQNERQHEDD